MTNSGRGGQRNGAGRPQKTIKTIQVFYNVFPDEKPVLDANFQTIKENRKIKDNIIKK